MNVAAKEFVENLISKYEYASSNPILGHDGKYHFVYLTYRKDNYKFYIGKHTTFSLEGDTYIGSGTYFSKALEKHGVDKFAHIRLCFATSEDAAYDLEAEILTPAVVMEYKDRLGVCYNLKSGGKGKQAYVCEESRLNPTKKMLSKVICEKGFEAKIVDVPNKEVLKRLKRGWDFVQVAILHHPQTFHRKTLNCKMNAGTDYNHYLNEDLIDFLEIGFEFGTPPRAEDPTSPLYVEIETFLKQKERASERLSETQAEKPMVTPSGKKEMVHKKRVLQKLREGWTYGGDFVKLLHPETLHAKQLVRYPKGPQKENVNFTQDLIDFLEKGFEFKYRKKTSNEDLNRESPLFQEIDDFCQNKLYNKSTKTKSQNNEQPSQGDPLLEDDFETQKATPLDGLDEHSSTDMPTFQNREPISTSFAMTDGFFVKQKGKEVLKPVSVLSLLDFFLNKGPLGVPESPSTNSARDTYIHAFLSQNLNRISQKDKEDLFESWYVDLFCGQDI